MIPPFLLTSFPFPFLTFLLFFFVFIDLLYNKKKHQQKKYKQQQQKPTNATTKHANIIIFKANNQTTLPIGRYIPRETWTPPPFPPHASSLPHPSPLSPPVPHSFRPECMCVRKTHSTTRPPVCAATLETATHVNPPPSPSSHPPLSPSPLLLCIRTYIGNATHIGKNDIR